MNNLFFQSHIDVFDPLLLTKKAPTYPPHDIIRINDNEFEIHTALAGYSKDEIEVTVHKDTLKVESVKNIKDEGSPTLHYLHQGISKRTFSLKFKLGHLIKATSVHLTDGMLRIRLNRDVPEVEETIKLQIS